MAYLYKVNFSVKQADNIMREENKKMKCSIGYFTIRNVPDVLSLNLKTKKCIVFIEIVKIYGIIVLYQKRRALWNTGC